jgi:hypothetical protein
MLRLLKVVRNLRKPISCSVEDLHDLSERKCLKTVRKYEDHIKYDPKFQTYHVLGKWNYE